MKNLWNDEEAKNFLGDLPLRVYTSNLLGRSDELVLHGGGNTSVKSQVDREDILYVKGSGWDLVSIKEEGFAPVKLDTLKEMAKLESLSDSDMVSRQKAAMTDKSAPNPSIEAILHAIIPYKFVDHTHADAVVMISNSKNGEELIKEVYHNFLIIPYVMPGVILAKSIYDMTVGLDWDCIEGIILHNHGIFTFDDDAKKSYDKMIVAVSQAEEFLEKNTSIKFDTTKKQYDTSALIKAIEDSKGFEVFTNINQSDLALTYANQNNLESIATRGVLTPEHIIRTKQKPLVLKQSDDINEKLAEYKNEYKAYFNRHAKDEIILNATPNYVVIQNFGIISFGKNQKEADIINDIVSHTANAVLRADQLGGYQSISEKDSFDMEYWELEQAKLKK
jgi:rhamnose utilization protein RhaD (predicted bifunctional aldolase and dehydrogenase)